MSDTTSVTTAVAKSVQDVLTVLAEKFGSTVEGLWIILVRGEFAFGVYSAFLFVACIVGTIYAVKLTKSYSDLDSKYDQEWRIVLGVVGFIVFTVAEFFAGDSAAMGIFAPEYMALQSVIEMLK